MDYFTASNTVESSRIIYTPSGFARSSLLYLQEIGSLQALKAHTSTRANLLSYLFFIVKSGTGELTYNAVSYQLGPGDCVFIDCRLPYSHTTSRELWNLSWVHFHGPDMQAIYDKYKARGGKVVFHSEKQESYHSILENLYKTAKSDSYVRDMEINQKLSGLLVLLMEDSWNPENHDIQGKRTHMQAIKDYLDGHYADYITLSSLSEKFYINKFYLLELFKEQYGVPVNEYLISVRITRSKELLRFTDKTMEEIAQAVGINGAAYFSRLFKKVEAMSPSEFRRLWQS